MSTDYFDAYLTDDLATFMQGGDSIIGRCADAAGGRGMALRLYNEINRVRAEYKAKRVLEPKGVA